MCQYVEHEHRAFVIDAEEINADVRGTSIR